LVTSLSQSQISSQLVSSTASVGLHALGSDDKIIALTMIIKVIVSEKNLCANRWYYIFTWPDFIFQFQNKRLLPCSFIEDGIDKDLNFSAGNKIGIFILSRLWILEVSTSSIHVNL
jgi:hypothetical protein